MIFFFIKLELCVLFSTFLIYTVSIDWIGISKFIKCNIEQTLFPTFDSIILLYIYFKDQNKPPFSSAWCCCSNMHSKGGILSATPDDQSNILMWKRLLYSNYNNVFQRVQSSVSKVWQNLKSQLRNQISLRLNYC